jgi:ribosomal protein L29
MKALKDKTEQELTKLLADKREALRTYRFNMAGTKAKNLKEGRTLRREIAQIMTQLSAKPASKKVAA